jgi:hypothetical protein
MTRSALIGEALEEAIAVLVHLDPGRAALLRALDAAAQLPHDHAHASRATGLLRAAVDSGLFDADR